MKQISYNYTLDHVLASLLQHTENLEDGYYRLSFLMETVSGIIERMHHSQQDGHFPGIVSRIVGVEVIRVENPGPMVLRVLDGMIVAGETLEQNDAIDTNYNRFDETYESSRADSGRFGESDPIGGNGGNASGETSKRSSLLRPTFKRSR